MEKKWSILEKKEIWEKCCRMEADIRTIFKSPSNWVNGFIRLVSFEGTWYHHRATDIFIPMEQKYLEDSYRIEKRPERSPISMNSRRIVWDYLKEEEAVQIIPFLPTSNMPKTFGAAGLGERCRNKKIFLKNGMVYEEGYKRVRHLQKNEEGTILQIYRIEQKYKRKDMESWNYDIYLWAKMGLTPSALYTSKESWNMIQFLSNNFHHIDFEDFILSSENDETKKEEKNIDLEKIEVLKTEETLGNSNSSQTSIETESSTSLEAEPIIEEVASKVELSEEMPITLESESVVEGEVSLGAELQEEIPIPLESEPVIEEEVSLEAELPEEIPIPLESEPVVEEEVSLEAELSEEIPIPLESEPVVEEEVSLEAELSEEMPIPLESEPVVEEEVSLEAELPEEMPITLESKPVVEEEVSLETELPEEMPITLESEPVVEEEVSLEAELPEEIPITLESEPVVEEEVSLEAELPEEIPITLESKPVVEEEVSLEAELPEEMPIPLESELVIEEEVSLEAELSEEMPIPLESEPVIEEEVSLGTELSEEMPIPLESEPVIEEEVALEVELVEEPEILEEINTVKKIESLNESGNLENQTSFVEEKIEDEFFIKSEELKNQENVDLPENAILSTKKEAIIGLESLEKSEFITDLEVPEAAKEFIRAEIVKPEIPTELENSKADFQELEKSSISQSVVELSESFQEKQEEKQIESFIQIGVPEEVLKNSEKDTIIEKEFVEDNENLIEVDVSTKEEISKNIEIPKEAEPFTEDISSGKIERKTEEVPKTFVKPTSEILDTSDTFVKLGDFQSETIVKLENFTNKNELEFKDKSQSDKEKQGKIQNHSNQEKQVEDISNRKRIEEKKESQEIEERQKIEEGKKIQEVKKTFHRKADQKENVTKQEQIDVQYKNNEEIKKIKDIVAVQGEGEVDEEMEKIQILLDCDKNRCRLEPYDKDILFDIIRGHWELFEAKKEQEENGEAVSLKLKEEGNRFQDEEEIDYQNLIARDPKLDIREGVVGIDFGTKSTVVVRQDATNRIVPIRIGTGNLSDEVKEEDFENPTIIEFTNVKKFLEDYQKEAGRPHTSCNDIFVSYDAYEDFRNCKPDDFYAYFSELKQWANREKGSVLIKDKQKEEYYLGEHMGMTEGIVNPIELYAYYIGLYINNMRNGIYLNYLMTFPVGYAKEVRDFIANSFYEGIKKSLPSSILSDPECMEQFQVKLGISEPAAYAVTALEQSHLEPKDETEQFMYGIFDFGGGTTDFDFGICRGATEEEYEREAYDYVLECFGADSDVTLGGENILELLAYQVYQKNLEVFREKKITFTLPVGENSFAGSETLLINSQIARRNMAILKEELRPLWHQEQGWRKKYQLDNESSQNEVDKEGIVVSLYNMNGEPVPQCILEFSSQDLVELIKKRIQKGIDSFFQCLIKMFLCKEKAKKEENKIYIFLAGNSSKSIFVKELFQKKIEEYYSKSKRMADEIGNAYFELIDPLTGESDNTENYVPNAKTGVAYGLLKSRPGSSIKIEKNYETDALQQSRFHYYLGRDHRHYFDCKFSPSEIEYKKWVPFQGATREVVRIYYTNNPIADSKIEQMPIHNVPYKEIRIDIKEDALLFIRTVEPDMIEYVVAQGLEEISTSEIKKCYFN